MKNFIDAVNSGKAVEGPIVESVTNIVKEGLALNHQEATQVQEKLKKLRRERVRETVEGRWTANMLKQGSVGINYKAKVEDDEDGVVLTDPPEAVKSLLDKLDINLETLFDQNLQVLYRRLSPSKKRVIATEKKPSVLAEESELSSALRKRMEGIRAGMSASDDEETAEEETGDEDWDE